MIRELKYYMETKTPPPEGQLAGSQEALEVWEEPSSDPILGRLPSTQGGARLVAGQASLGNRVLRSLTI